MPVFKPRNRLVNFRLSEEEFDRLQGGCRVHGARSISDYARSCVLRDLANTAEVLTPVAEKRDVGVSAADARDTHVQQITSKVTSLETRIDDLLKLVDSLRQATVSVPATVTQTEQQN